MAINFYLKLDTCEGECTDSGYEKTIKLHSWSWGGSNTATVGGTTGMSGGTVSLSDLSGMKDFDKASPEMFKAMVTGKTLATGVLTGVKSTGSASPAAFIVITLTDCFITSQSLSAASEVPGESFSLAFSTAKVDYLQQDKDTGALTSTGAITYNVLTKTQS